MSILCQQKDGATIIAENTDISLNWGTSSTGQERMAAPGAPNNCTLPLFREQKIHRIRQQLAAGTYDLDMRLDVVVGRLLENLIGARIAQLTICVQMLLWPVDNLFNDTEHDTSETTLFSVQDPIVGFHLHKRGHFHRQQIQTPL